MGSSKAWKRLGSYAVIAALGASIASLSGCGGSGADASSATAPKLLDEIIVKAGLPVWSGATGSTRAQAEPPLAAAASVTFGVTSVSQPADGSTVLSGIHGLAAGVVNNYRIGVYVHGDVFYLQSNATSTIGTDGTFSVTLPSGLHGGDRAVVVLYQPPLDLLGGSNCNAAEGYCRGMSSSTTKMTLPIDPSQVAAFTTSYFPAAVVGTYDPEIAGLKRMMSSIVISGGPYGDGRLIRSYRDMDSAFLYDQALAVIAFSDSGDQADAEAIINAMAKLQETSGAWEFAYMTDGSQAEPGVDKRIAGANAWFAMALNTYQEVFDNPKYLAMSTRLHNYLATQLVDITINGTAQTGIRFAPTDYAPGRSQLFALEHQLDAYAAMHQFYELNGGSTYQVAANKLRSMSESLWNGSRFLAGYDASINQLTQDERYLDSYSWSVLALGNTGSSGQNFAGSLGQMCDYFNMNGRMDLPSRTLTGVIGFYDLIVNNVPKSNPYVWSEGSVGAIMAMRQGAPTLTCQGNSSQDILDSINYMVDPLGGMAYSTENTNPDFGSSGSVAGTAWLYFANANFNPYKHFTP